MLNILYYTSGVTGIGRLVHGMALYNALKRQGVSFSFTIISHALPGRAAVCDCLGISHVELPRENHSSFSLENYRESLLFQNIEALKPDILIVDRMWFSLHGFIDTLQCRKIFITSQVRDKFFTIETDSAAITFDPCQYDHSIAIEPFRAPVELEIINPLIIRNHDEILSRKEALAGLGLTEKKPVCFMGLNFKEGFPEKLFRQYRKLKKEYQVIQSTNLQGEGIFPIADYYNAVDLVVSSATYNTFWEALYFDKEAVLETVPVEFCDQQQRLRECSGFEFTENGADQMAGIILNL